jgi:acetyl esterase
VARFRRYLTYRILANMNRTAATSRLLALAFAGIGSCAAAAFKDAQFEVKPDFDIVYGTAAVGQPKPGEKDLLLDLYQPAGPAAPAIRPGLVLVHGGGFIQGDKRSPNANMANLCREMAARGYVCVSINYRLQKDDPPGPPGADPKAHIRQAAVDDSEQAVRWMIRNAPRYGVDPKRIALGGSSAGSITCLYLAYGEQGKRLPIRAVVDMWGMLATADESGRPVDRMERIQSGKPPLIVIHGTKDPAVNYSHAVKIRDRAKQVGVECDFNAVDGAGHNVPLTAIVDGVTLYQKIADFLYRQLDLGNLK